MLATPQQIHILEMKDGPLLPVLRLRAVKVRSQVSVGQVSIRSYKPSLGRTFPGEMDPTRACLPTGRSDRTLSHGAIENAITPLLPTKHREILRQRLQDPERQFLRVM